MNDGAKGLGWEKVLHSWAQLGGQNGNWDRVHLYVGHIINIVGVM